MSTAIKRSWKWIALACLCLPSAVSAGNLDALRAQIENSLLVEGEVQIEPDGSVSQVKLSREDRLTPTITGLVRESALKWKFKPVLLNGTAVRARSPMSVRLVAKQEGAESYQVRLSAVSFGGPSGSQPGDIGSRKMTPPVYPEEMAARHVFGTVYLVVKVARDGTVADAVVEQVNLRTLATEKEMEKFRQVFAKNTLAAARRWTFRVPTEGAQVNDPFWSVRVPVAYTLNKEPSEDDKDSYGRWFAYIPGPRTAAPWLQANDPSNFSPDALPAGGVYLAGKQDGPQLLTPLQGG